jgi:hypothetical protein
MKVNESDTTEIQFKVYAEFLLNPRAKNLGGSSG